MESSKGIVMEARTPVAVAAPKRTISSTVTVADSARVNESTSVNTTVAPKRMDSEIKDGDTEKYSKSTPLPNAEKMTSPSVDGEQDPLAEKKELIMELVEFLGQNLNEDARDAMKQNLIEGLYDKDDKKGKQENNFTDMLAEMTRLIAILMALFLLLIRDPKDRYSGKDLALPNNAPEGESNDKLTKAIFGQTIQDSWRNFREEVDRIEDVPFGELMTRVLAANTKNKVKKIQVKLPETSTAVFDRMHKMRVGKFGRKPTLVQKSATAPRGGSK